MDIYHHCKFNELFDLDVRHFAPLFKLLIDLLFTLLASELRRESDCTDCVFCDDFVLNISGDLERTGFVTIQIFEAKEISDFRADLSEICNEKLSSDKIRESSKNFSLLFL